MVRFDYKNQAWLEDGVYVRCGHPDTTDCRCYGKTHQGQPAAEDAEIQDKICHHCTSTYDPSKGSCGCFDNDCQ